MEGHVKIERGMIFWPGFSETPKSRKSLRKEKTPMMPEKKTAADKQKSPQKRGNERSTGVRGISTFSASRNRALKEKKKPFAKKREPTKGSTNYQGSGKKNKLTKAICQTIDKNS